MYELASIPQEEEDAPGDLPEALEESDAQVTQETEATTAPGASLERQSDPSIPDAQPPEFPPSTPPPVVGYASLAAIETLRTPSEPSEASGTPPASQAVAMARARVRRMVPYGVRCAMKALHSLAMWPMTRISAQLNRPYRTVFDVCNEPSTPRPKRQGLKVYESPQLRRLIDEIEASPTARRLNYTALAMRCDVPASNSTISRYLRSKGYRRCVAVAKPFLTDQQRLARLDWAIQHQNWTVDEWKRIIWTDESAFHIGGQQRVFVTRTRAQRYEPSCLSPRFQKAPHVMVWAAFCGGYKCWPPVVWDPAWGKMTSSSFCDRVLPGLRDFNEEVALELQYSLAPEHQKPIVMMDNAPCHRAVGTQLALSEARIELLSWPANSPDLNPIENVWNDMKRRISERRPRPTTRESMKDAILEEWDHFDEKQLESYVESLPRRIEMVINSGGRITQW